MLRKVYLEGEIGDKFGKEFTIFAETPRDIFRCLEGNFSSDFRTYIIECTRKNIGFTFEIGKKNLQQEEELLLTLGEGDVLISTLPAGSGGGVGKIFAAVAIGILMWYAPYLMTGLANPGSMATGFTTLGEAFAAGHSLGTVGLLTAGVAVNLALTGIQQLMAPDPATDKSSDESYLFNGSEQNIVEGDPVPVLYGQLKVPGQPISFSVINTTSTYNNGTTYDREAPVFIGQMSTGGYRPPLAGLNSSIGG